MVVDDAQMPSRHIFMFQTVKNHTYIFFLDFWKSVFFLHFYFFLQIFKKNLEKSPQIFLKKICQKKHSDHIPFFLLKQYFIQIGLLVGQNNSMSV